MGRLAVVLAGILAVGACHGSSPSDNPDAGDAAISDAGHDAGDDASCYLPSFPEHCACASLCDPPDADPMCSSTFDQQVAKYEDGGAPYCNTLYTTNDCGGDRAVIEHGVDTGTYYVYDADSGALVGELYDFNGRSSGCAGTLPPDDCFTAGWKFVNSIDVATCLGIVDAGADGD